jgi:hypothetical protein
LKIYEIILMGIQHSSLVDSFFPFFAIENGKHFHSTPQQYNLALKILRLILIYGLNREMRESDRMNEYAISRC